MTTSPGQQAVKDWLKKKVSITAPRWAWFLLLGILFWDIADLVRFL